MGPAIETERYFDPSLFLLIFISLIPCNGAMVTPSVMIARPTRTARSSLSSREVSGRQYFPAAISFANISAESSLPLVFRISLRGSAISISCILATLSARSKAILSSIVPEMSASDDFAKAVCSNIRFVSDERFE